MPTLNEPVTLVQGLVKQVKCKPGQGKLNRLIVKAQNKLRDLGYPERRFKRDYQAGTAVYTCPTTGKNAFVNIHNKEISGSCFESSNQG